MKTIPVFLASLAYISAVLAGKFIGLSTNGLIGLPVYARGPSLAGISSNIRTEIWNMEFT